VGCRPMAMDLGTYLLVEARSTLATNASTLNFEALSPQQRFLLRSLQLHKSYNLTGRQEGGCLANMIMVDLAPYNRAKQVGVNTATADQQPGNTLVGS